jgi:hypothetical protein
MPVQITNSRWVSKTLHVATNSSLREVITLGEPNDTWTIAPGALMTIACRPAPGHPTLNFALSSVDGYISVVDPNTRQIALNISFDLLPQEPGTYYYDLLVNDGGFQIRRMAGQLVVEQGIAA